MSPRRLICVARLSTMHVAGQWGENNSREAVGERRFGPAPTQAKQSRQCRLSKTEQKMKGSLSSSASTVLVDSCSKYCLLRQTCSRLGCLKSENIGCKTVEPTIVLVDQRTFGLNYNAALRYRTRRLPWESKKWCVEGERCCARVPS